MRVYRTVSGWTPPLASSLVAGSMPMLPEQYTMPLYLMACENCGSGAGEFCVETASLVGDMMPDD